MSHEEYYHVRLKDSRSFNRFSTVTVYATDYRGKWRKPGVLVVKGYNQYTNR